jgi:hypothetical protein
MSTRLIEDRAARALALRGLRGVLAALRGMAAAPPPDIVTYPEAVPWGTPPHPTPAADVAALEAALAFHPGNPVVVPKGATVEPPASALLQLLERLTYLLGLSDLEREFFAAGAARGVPDAWDGLAAYADWLGERGNDAGAVRVRKLTPHPGDVLVHYVPPSTSTQEALELHVAPARALAEALAARGVETVFAVVPPGGSIGLFPEEQMAAAGWVPAGRVAEEREACAAVAEDRDSRQGVEIAEAIRARGG